MTYETLRLVNLAPIEVPVDLGDGKEYVLREASEGAAVEYQNLMLAATKFGDNMKPTGINGMANGEPLLVSRCLFEKVNGDLRPVPHATILAWPARIVKPIFNLAMKISGMGVKDEEDSSKNSPTPAVSG